MKANIYLLLALAVCAASCKKDDETLKIHKQWLTESPWMMSSFSSVLPLDNGKDFLDPLPAYEKDDLVFFGGDGTYRIDEGATKESPNRPQTKFNGTWQLTGKTLVIDGKTADQYVLTPDQLVIVLSDFRRAYRHP